MHEDFFALRLNTLQSSPRLAANYKRGAKSCFVFAQLVPFGTVFGLLAYFMVWSNRKGETETWLFVECTSYVLAPP